MLCDICHNGLEGIWDPSKTVRLGIYSEWFLEKDETPSGSERSSVEPSTSEKRSEVERYIYAHHKTRESFLQSQDLGCVMCNRFLISKNLESYPFPVDDGEPIRQAEEADYFSIFTVFFEHSNRNVIMTVRHGDTIGGFDLVPAEDPMGTPNMKFEVDSSTSGPRTWTLIHEWVDRCMDGHAHCNESSSSDFLPTRLLAIDDSRDPRTFRLVMGAECPPGANYCTLSHCWGNKPIEGKRRLLTTTIDQLREKQPMDTLPKTFRDAMEVASTFGIKFIWIDSLCIFQDSAEDWRAEASTMQQVYKNSFLGISALGAEDDEGGLFFDRDPTHVAPTIVQMKHTQDGSPEPFRFELEKGWSWRLSFEPEPIIRRGWVVQERLLPPRVLHFGRNQVYWECREQNACEIHPQTVYCSSSYDDSAEQEEERKPHIWKQLLDAPDRRTVEDPYMQLFVDWKAITYTYTECKLTVASDKLVALSGLANDMKIALQSMKPGPHRYLAGLWEERLVDELCWLINDKGKRPGKYRAPSWSWASVDGRISFTSLTAAENCHHFLDECTAYTEYLGKYDTGEVTGGRLTLTGPWCKLQLGHVEGTGYRQHQTSRAVKYFIHPDTNAAFEVEQGALSTGQGLGRPSANFDVIDEMPMETIAVPIEASLWVETAYSAWIMLLVRVGGMDGERVEEGEERYRRVGLALATFGTKEKAVEFFAAFPKKRITVI